MAVSNFGLLPIFSHRIEAVILRENGNEMEVLLRSLDHMDWRTLFEGSSIYAWLSA